MLTRLRGAVDSRHELEGDVTRWAAIAALGMALAGAAAPASPAAEAPLFLVDTPFDPINSGIYLLDRTTGALTLRGSIDVAYGPLLAMAAANERVLYVSGSDSAGCFSCFLYRVTLDPFSTTPAEILPIGPFVAGTVPVSGVCGMSFREDGTLWAVDEDADGLYVVDPQTASMTKIGTVTEDVLGGDVTFDANDALWMWTNAPATHGLYQLDLATAAATLLIERPDLRMAGLAALGHSELLYGANPFTDTLYEIQIPSGFTGFQVPLTLNGAVFDHKRGDLDSPYCANDAACDDRDACTVDTCLPGGCRNVAPAGCCTSDLQCGDGNPCTDDQCAISGSTGTCTHVPNTGSCDDGNACTIGDSCSGGSCQPGAPATLAEVSGLQEAADKTTMTWVPLDGATSYDVIRGAIAVRPVGPGGGDETCLGNLGGAALQDFAVPAAETGFWYLARGVNACAAGTYGTRSDGTPRATQTCP